MRLLPLLLLVGCVQGSLPSGLEVSLSPDPPIVGESIVVSVDVAPTGGFTELTYTYEWFEDASLRADIDGDHAPGEEVDAGEVWRVIVTPFGDGIEGRAASASVTVPGGSAVDIDGDGHDASVDCDDDDPSVHPGADDACDGADSDCDPSWPEGDVDQDGDGVPVCGEDCDDADPERFPGNPTVSCIDGGLSTDCTAWPVDELQTWAPDRDGDSDGDQNAESWRLRCVDTGPPEPTGWVSDRHTDCDDLDPDREGIDRDDDGVSTCDGDVFATGESADEGAGSELVYPGADELCDGIDNDLDGVVDEDFDGDGDGWLDPAEATACASLGPDLVFDCDDTDPLLNPADEDNDTASGCDGDCDDNDPSVHPLDLDGDGSSLCDAPPDCEDSDPTKSSVDGDGDGFSTCDGDCDDDSPDAFPGAIGFCDGEYDTDCDGVPEPEEQDADNDGASLCEGDCDDGDPALSPTDADGDGFSGCAGDCDDTQISVHPGAPPLCDDFLDNDCDGPDANQADSDGDSETPCEGDCDDSDPSLNGLDLDDDEVSLCEGDCDDGDDTLSPLIDADGDGWSTCPIGDDPADCQDTSAYMHPGIVEICGYPEDENCDGEVPPLCTSCQHALEDGGSYGSGWYDLDTDGDGPLPAFDGWCDMDTDGGGWTLIQRTNADGQDNAQLVTGYDDLYNVTIHSWADDGAIRVAARHWQLLGGLGEVMAKHVVEKSTGGACEPLYFVVGQGGLSVPAPPSTDLIFLFGDSDPAETVGGESPAQFSTTDSGPGSASCVLANASVPWFYPSGDCGTCPPASELVTPGSLVPVCGTSTLSSEDLFGNLFADACSDDGPATPIPGYHTELVREYYVR